MSGVSATMAKKSRNLRSPILLGALLILFVGSMSASALADCVFGAQAKTNFIVLDNHTIILTGGYGSKILIKTFAFLNTGSQLTVLKDSFCSFESAVLYVDGEVVDANQVTNIR